jgi:hypothetical protein
MRTYTIPKYGITVQVMTNNGKQAGSIVSGLKEVMVGDGPFESDFEIQGAIHALESLILGHACSGLDIGSEAYVTGLDTALEAIANNL